VKKLSFEVWPIRNGCVITRPVQTDKDDEGHPVFTNESDYRENLQIAINEVRVALDDLDKAYKAKTLRIG